MATSNHMIYSLERPTDSNLLYVLLIGCSSLFYINKSMERWSFSTSCFIVLQFSIHSQCLKQGGMDDGSSPRDKKHNNITFLSHSSKQRCQGDRFVFLRKHILPLVLKTLATKYKIGGKEVTINS